MTYLYTRSSFLYAARLKNYTKMLISSNLWDGSSGVFVTTLRVAWCSFWSMTRLGVTHFSFSFHIHMAAILKTYQTKNALMAMTTRFSWERNTFYLTQHFPWSQHKCIFVLYNKSTHKLMDILGFVKNIERAFFLEHANRNCNTRKTIRHALW
jgi:hypothetical protein